MSGAGYLVDKFGQPLRSPSLTTAQVAAGAVALAGVDASGALVAPDGSLLPALTAGQRAALVGGSLQGGFRVFSDSLDTAGTTGTLQIQWQGLAPFNGVYLVYENHSIADILLGKCRVAAATVKGGNGSNLTWLPGSFNGVASTTAAPITIPATAFATVSPNEQFKPIVSDLIAVSPADAQNLLYTRSDLPGLFSGTDPGAASMLQWNNKQPFLDALGNPFQFQVGASSGVVANDTVGISMSTNGRSMQPLGVIFNYTVKTVFVAAIGGSHERGDGTVGDAMGFIWRACMKKTLASGSTGVWSPFNSARAGGGSAPALANLKLMIAAGIVPDVLLILASSGDDGQASAALMAAAQSRLIEVLAICRRNGIQPIICTAPPIGTYPTGPGSPDDLRKAQNNWGRNLCTQLRIGLLDLERIYVDPNDPLQHQMNPAHSPTGIHADDFLQDIASDQLVPMI